MSIQGLLRATISDAGNEHRMGSHEAPPAILSIYLGDYLNDILEHIEQAKTFTDKTLSTINLGLENMPKVVKDISDRNRTSPIAFTGNKFELRALGSSANPSDAAKVMNLICAYGYSEIIKRLTDKKGDVKTNALKLLKDILVETKAIRFEGNNYDPAWKKEAKKRGLFVVDTTPEAIKYQLDPKCVKLFEEFNVLSKRELESRIEIKFEAYSNTKIIEFKTAINMARRNVLASILNQITRLADAFNSLKDAGITNQSIQSDLKVLDGLYTTIQKKKADLKTFIIKIEDESDPYKKAYAIATKGADLLNTLREDVDLAELKVDEDFWGLATYDQLLLS